MTRRPWLVYLGLTPLAFPILEILLFRGRALQQAHDVFDDDIPRLYSIAADWWQYGPSLWNTHLTAGNALFAQFALPPTTPDVVLSFFVPPFIAYALNAALMVFLSGLSMHLFLRDSVRLPAVACFAGGIIAIFAFAHYIYGYAVLLLPLLLWSIDHAVLPGAARKWFAGSALLVAFILFSSQIQLAVIEAGVVLVWVLLTAPGGRRDRLVGAGRMIGAWAVGALVAAPVVLAQLVGVVGSHRAIWGSETAPTNVVAQMASRYIRIPLGVPVELGGSNDVLGGPIGLYGTWFPGPIGLICLAIGLAAGLLLPRRTRRERTLLLLLPALILADVLAVLAGPLLGDFGFLNSFQFVRVRHLIPFAVVANAAIGIGWLARPQTKSSLEGRRRTVAAIVVAVLAISTVLFLLAQVVAIVLGVDDWLRAGGPTAGWDQRGLAWAFALGAFAVAAVAIVIVVLAAVRRGRRDRDSLARTGLVTGLVAALLLVGIVSERGLYARSERLLAGELATWAATVPPTAAQRFVAAQPGWGRVATVNDHPNRGLSVGLDGVDGYQTMYPLRYHALFGALVRPQLDGKPFLTRYFDHWGNRAYAWGPTFNKPIADLLGLRWLIVNSRSRIDPSLGRLYRDQPEAPGPGFVERYRDGGAVVYENQAAFPRAFIVHDAVVTRDRPALTAALSGAASKELRSRVYVAEGDAPGLALPGPPGSGEDASIDAGDAATIVVDTPDRVEVYTRNARSGLLVLADTYATGWNVEIDGVAAEIVPVDGALRGIALPAGEHRVAFTYRPIATIAGFGIALLTFVALMVWLAWPRARRPRGTEADTRPRRSPDLDDVLADDVEPAVLRSSRTSRTRLAAVG